MKKYLYNQKGSILILSLLTMIFLGIILSGIVPLVNSQILYSSLNNDAVEAQYAAEAGAKRAIVGLMKNRTDWAWIGAQQPFTDAYSTTEKNYKVTLDHPINNGATPTAGVTYTITSVGSIGKAQKTVVVNVTAGSSNTVFQYGIYAAQDMSLWSGTITGDVATNSSLTLTSGLRINGNVHTNGSLTNNGGYISGTATYGTTVVDRGIIVGGTPIKKTTAFTTIDIASLMQSAPTMPTIPSFPSSSGYTSISSGTALTAGKYYCNGDYANWNGSSFNIAAGQTLELYVKGNFTGNFKITGSGTIKIYAKNQIDLNSISVSGSTVTIYAGTTFGLNSNSAVNGSISTTIQSVGNFSMWGSSSVTGNTVAFYSGGDLSLGGSTNITGKVMTLQSTRAMNLYGSVSQSATGGTINVYCGGTLSLQGQTTVSTVTMIALASQFNGGVINENLSGAVTKLYISGNLDLNSKIAIGSAGTGMIVSLGTVSLNGASLSTTSLLAVGNVNVYSGSCGGVYSNGTFVMVGGTVTYVASASTTLGLDSGAPFSIISWNKKPF